MSQCHPYFNSRHRPQTAKKLSILRKYFSVWLKIWSGDKCAGWVSKDWYVVDLFAGSGEARGASGEPLSGSPLVFLEEIAVYASRLEAGGVHISLILVEDDRPRFEALNSRVDSFLTEHPEVSRVLDVRCVNYDANKAVRQLDLQVTDKTPAFLFVDPFGAEIQRATMDRLVSMPWKLDILFNYMVESLRRTFGAAQGGSSRAPANRETIGRFFGPEVALKDQSEVEDPATYARAVFGTRGFESVAFRMKKPGANVTQYILLFASRNSTVVKIVCQVYAKEMTDHFGQMSLLPTEEYLQAIEVIR